MSQRLKKTDPVKFTIHYADGSTEVVEQGLVAHTRPSSGVEVLTLNTTPLDFLILLAALEGSVDRILDDQ